MKTNLTLGNNSKSIFRESNHITVMRQMTTPENLKIFGGFDCCGDVTLSVVSDFLLTRLSIEKTFTRDNSTPPAKNGRYVVN